MRVALVDSLPSRQADHGDVPEKMILDVAGFLERQGPRPGGGWSSEPRPPHPAYFLERTATTLAQDDDGVTVCLDDGSEIRTKAVLVTAGIGSSARDRCRWGGDWLGRGLGSSSPASRRTPARTSSSVGGGTPAFDWALHLEPVARSVTLVHRRDAFRAHERTVQAVRATSVDILTRPGVPAIHGNGTVESVDIDVDGEITTRPAQRSSRPSGSSPTSAPSSTGASRWRSGTSSSTPRCAPTWSGSSPPETSPSTRQVRLIAVGFGEAATAVNNAAVVVDPSAHVFRDTPAKAQLDG